VQPDNFLVFEVLFLVLGLQFLQDSTVRICQELQASVFVIWVGSAGMKIAGFSARVKQSRGWGRQALLSMGVIFCLEDHQSVCLGAASSDSASCLLALQERKASDER
jgi:hypothetical protein